MKEKRTQSSMASMEEKKTNNHERSWKSRGFFNLIHSSSFLSYIMSIPDTIISILLHGDDDDDKMKLKNKEFDLINSFFFLFHSFNKETKVISLFNIFYDN